MRKTAKIVVCLLAVHGASELGRAFMFGFRNPEMTMQMTPRERINAFYASRIES
jgi:hypothetical protein